MSVCCVCVCVNNSVVNLKKNSKGLAIFCIFDAIHVVFVRALQFARVHKVKAKTCKFFRIN